MIITETKVSVRPNTSVPFFKETNPPELLAVQATVKSLRDNGNVTYVTTISSDGLTETAVATFDSIETYNAVETAHGIALDNAFISYVKSNNFSPRDFSKVEDRRSTYVQTGFDQPFTCTTVYTWPETNPMISGIGASMQTNDVYGKLTNVSILETSLSLTHTYDNSSDFTDHCFYDLYIVPRLFENNVTRTITYALVN
jgi:hypothetical protein